MKLSEHRKRLRAITIKPGVRKGEGFFGECAGMVRLFFHCFNILRSGGVVVVKKQIEAEKALCKPTKSLQERLHLQSLMMTEIK